jgi:2-deoxy-D-gluconate 3-dehydrogenase
MTDLFSLLGKVAIVTGGNGGIGKAIALALSSQGADIVIADYNNLSTPETVKEIAGLSGSRAIGIEVDIREEKQIERMTEKALAAFQRIDILVNVAGIAGPSNPQDTTAEVWDNVINTNLKGTFLCSKAVHPAFKAAEAGKIINIASMTAIFGSGMLPAYSFSKEGIVQLTKSLAVSWAKDNIQVNAIAPGWFKTELGRGAREADPTHEYRIASLTPMGRWGKVSELGGAAIFLASHASDFVTGITLPVDGGYSIALNGMDGPFA